MATTLDWVKSVRADIRGDCGKGLNLVMIDIGVNWIPFKLDVPIRL